MSGVSGLALRTVLLIAAVSLALPASAQPRTQLVSDLAFALGQTHALRQVCNGPGDQYWRNRMSAMIGFEAPDPAARGPLAERFNDGFRVARQQYPRCTLQSRAAERSAAAHGKVLAGLLARGSA
jgi:uncharacterized protein (TIGR02301 family)